MRGTRSSPVTETRTIAGDRGPMKNVTRVVASLAIVVTASIVLSSCGFGGTPDAMPPPIVIDLAGPPPVTEVSIPKDWPETPWIESEPLTQDLDLSIKLDGRLVPAKVHRVAWGARRAGWPVKRATMWSHAVKPNQVLGRMDWVFEISNRPELRSEVEAWLANMPATDPLDKYQVSLDVRTRTELAEVSMRLQPDYIQGPRVNYFVVVGWDVPDPPDR